jgi:hypothetical protein
MDKQRFPAGTRRLTALEIKELRQRGIEWSGIAREAFRSELRDVDSEQDLQTR